MALPALAALGLAQAAAAPIEWWVSSCAPPLKLLACTPATNASLTRQSPLAWGGERVASAAEIAIDSSQRFQSVYGIGSSLEASTDYNLNLLSNECAPPALALPSPPHRAV